MSPVGNHFRRPCTAGLQTQRVPCRYRWCPPGAGCASRPRTGRTQTALVDVWSGSIDDFLRFQVLERGGRYEQDDEGIWRPFPGEFVTIKELIRHFSDREGGVHYGLGRSTNPIIESIRHFADASLRRTIIACGRIVVRALEPVAAAVMLREHKWPEGLGVKGHPFLAVSYVKAQRNIEAER